MVLPELLLCLLWKTPEDSQSWQAQGVGMKRVSQGDLPAPAHHVLNGQTWLVRRDAWGGDCQGQPMPAPKLGWSYLSRPSGQHQRVLQRTSAAWESREGTRATCLKRNQAQQWGTPPAMQHRASQRGLMLTHILPNLLQPENLTCKRNTSSSLTFLVKV